MTRLFKWLFPETYGSPLPETVEKIEEYTGPVCTYCGGTKFFGGPSGGISTNILCANPDCRHWFNWHEGILPMDDLHRVEPNEAEKASQADEKQLKADAEFAARMNVGTVDYRSHGSIGLLRQRQLKEKWTYPKPEEIDEICGFIAAMAAEIAELKKELYDVSSRSGMRP